MSRRKHLEESISAAFGPPLVAALHCLRPSDGWLDRYPHPLAPDGSTRQSFLESDLSDVRDAALEYMVSHSSHESTRLTTADELAALDWLYGLLPPHTRSLLRFDWEHLGLPASQAQVNALIGTSVAIVGTGLAGLVAARTFAACGAYVDLYDRNCEPGGTWYQNQYPGARVDVAGQLYWPQILGSPSWNDIFPTAHEIQAAIRSVFNEIRLEVRSVYLSTEVQEARYDEGTNRWLVSGQRADQTSLHISYDHLVVAVGQLNSPRIPEFAFASPFRGDQVHSSGWSDSSLIRDRDVVVVGGAASAAQLIPEIAESAATVTLIQRSASWFTPAPLYRKKVPATQQILGRHLPRYARFYRSWYFRSSIHGGLDAAIMVPAQGGGLVPSRENFELRKRLMQHLDEVLGNYPELRQQLTPEYIPTAKRLILDDGTFLHTLTRPDVNVVNDTVVGLSKSEVLTKSGLAIDADVIIWATGFAAQRATYSLRIIGRGGESLESRWGDCPEAYLGIHVPGFPNMHLLFGPNTNVVIHGSNTFMIEAQVAFIRDLAIHQASTKSDPLEIRRDYALAYSLWLEMRSQEMTWSSSDARSWYQNEDGKVTQNWPGDSLEYWRCLSLTNPNCYTSQR